MRPVFDTGFTPAGLKNGIPVKNERFKAHVLPVRCHPEVQLHLDWIRYIYCAYESPIHETFRTIKNHIGNTWRRWEKPEARALIEAHIRGEIFEED